MTTPKHLAHYQILAPLGAGGMGEVYRALDTRLNREIALKTLPKETGADPQKFARFQREARALAALDHPNIVTVHSVEEADGIHFLTMGLFDGQTLDRQIPEKGLPVATFFEIALPLADAVAAAHARNIIHRDLKPTNIMLTPDGRLKVLDFGLAKLAEPAHAEHDAKPDAATRADITQEGLVVGTVPYMSPEQVEDKPVDHRSDIFSLGILLYEMATGRRPFAADSNPGLMSAILKDTPTAITEHRAELPPSLDRLIQRCLEKNPQDRIQTARDIHNGLKALKQETESGPAAVARQVTTAPGTAPQAQPQDLGIAVLPFADMSPAKDQDYFCEGMAEEIMNALVHIPGIRVASRTAAFRARHENREPADIGRTLNVGHILEGSVRVAGPRMRVTAQLVDTQTGYHLWSERYDREAADVFAVQDEIAAGVVEAVKTQLISDDSAAEKKQHVKPRSQVKNLSAYRHFLKGRHLRFRNDHGAAVESYRQAVALDPTHGPSWVGLGETLVLAATYGLRQVRPALEEVKNALATADRLQGETAAGLCVQGMIAFCERDWRAAETAFTRALEAGPDQVQAACWFGMMLAARKRTDDAVAMFESARAMDPLAAFPYGMSGLNLLCLGKADEAERFLEVGLDFEPEHTLCLWSYASVLVKRGDADRAVEVSEKALALGRRQPHYLGFQAWVLACADRFDEARALLAELDARPALGSDTRTPAIIPAAWAQAALGETDAAWETLERAREEDQTLVTMTGHPGFDPLRDDPKFAAFEESLGVGGGSPQ